MDCQGISMHYWITTHWPPRAGDPRPVGHGVYLPLDRAEVGQDLAAGDLILVYQAQSGRIEMRTEIDGTIHRVPCLPGKGGIVAIGRALRAMARDETSEVEHYVDGTSIHWAWFAPLEVLSTSGFVPREALNGILGYAPNYVFRGFGEQRSGLKKVDEATYLRIEAAFIASRPADKPIMAVKPREGGPPGGEGEPHRLLKEYVAATPEAALAENGLVLVKKEHWFPTHDRADVVLHDRFGRIIGLEVEVHVGDDDNEGFLQAIKYAAMLEPIYDRSAGDSRAVLVAYSISAGMRTKCARYDVECVEIGEAIVREWHRTHGTAINAPFTAAPPSALAGL
jgi:hypothetical protein